MPASSAAPARHQERHRHADPDRRQHLHRQHDDQRRHAAIGNGGTTGSVAGNIVDNGALIFNRSDALTYAGVDQRHRHADPGRAPAR